MAVGSRRQLDHGIASPPSTYPFPVLQISEVGYRGSDEVLRLVLGVFLLIFELWACVRLGRSGVFLMPDP